MMLSCFGIQASERPSLTSVWRVCFIWFPRGAGYFGRIFACVEDMPFPVGSYLPDPTEVMLEFPVAAIGCKFQRVRNGFEVQDRRKPNPKQKLLRNRKDCQASIGTDTAGNPPPLWRIGRPRQVEPQPQPTSQRPSLQCQQPAT